MINDLQIYTIGRDVLCVGHVPVSLEGSGGTGVSWPIIITYSATRYKCWVDRVSCQTYPLEPARPRFFSGVHAEVVIYFMVTVPAIRVGNDETRYRHYQTALIFKIIITP